MKNNAENHQFPVVAVTHTPGDLSFSFAIITDKDTSNSRHFSLVMDDAESLVSN
jgi:hypothetical protein